MPLEAVAASGQGVYKKHRLAADHGAPVWCLAGAIHVERRERFALSLCGVKCEKCVKKYNKPKPPTTADREPSRLSRI